MESRFLAGRIQLFNDQMIYIWMVVYDSNPNRVYCYNKFKSVISAIDGSIRNYVLDESVQSERVIVQCMEQVSELEHAKCIPIIFGNLKIAVYKISLDHTNFIHALLSECYDKITDDDLRKRIQHMFSAEV